MYRVTCSFIALKMANNFFIVVIILFNILHDTEHVVHKTFYSSNNLVILTRMCNALCLQMTANEVIHMMFHFITLSTPSKYM